MLQQFAEIRDHYRANHETISLNRGGDFEPSDETDKEATWMVENLNAALTAGAATLGRAGAAAPRASTAASQFTQIKQQLRNFINGTGNELAITPKMFGEISEQVRYDTEQHLYKRYAVFLKVKYGTQINWGLLLGSSCLNPQGRIGVRYSPLSRQQNSFFKIQTLVNI